MNTNRQILDEIMLISSLSKDSKLNDELFTLLDESLDTLSNFLNISKMESFIVANIFNISIKERTVYLSDLIKFFDCEYLQIIKFYNCFQSLIDKDIISSDYSFGKRLILINLEISKKYENAIITNDNSILLNKDDTVDIIKTMEKFHLEGKKFIEEKINTESLFNNIISLLKQNLSFPFFKYIDSLALPPDEIYTIFDLSWHFLDGWKEMEIIREADSIYKEYSKKICFIKQFITGKSKLISEGLIDISNSEFYNEAEFSITQKTLEFIIGEDAKFFMRIEQRSNVIANSKIKEKKLFYNPVEERQIKQLFNSLEEGQFNQVRQRLIDKNFPTGICILFYGYPGTGKTETAMQLAKTTGRDLIHVDISSIKSMWFGESEKKVKKIFTDFNNYASKCKVKPILLFNEADAIISKRKSINSSSVDQTENVMQNIILEQMEKFDGILIATTNLADNFDQAFERRFIYKIEFTKPDISVKENIWQSKLPDLSAGLYNRLATDFNFSGGQIDNVSRKFYMWEITNEKQPNENDIIQFCIEETLNKNNRKPLGFNLMFPSSNVKG